MASETQKIIVHQIIQALLYQGFNPKDFIAYEDEITIHFTIKETRNYLYKGIVRYDYGPDTYSVRFMKMYIGNELEREDWYVPMVTEWVSDIYWDMFETIFPDYYRRRNTLEYTKMS